MRIACEYSENEKEWYSGWLIGFVHNSTEKITCGMIESPSGRITEVPKYYIRTKLVLSSGNNCTAEELMKGGES